MAQPDSAFNNSWRILNLCPADVHRNDLASLVKREIPGAYSTEIGDYPDGRQLTQLITAQQPNVCFVDTTSNLEKALTLISTINRIDSGIGVVALLDTNHPETILRCLRQGATEFMITPITVEQLESGLGKLLKTLPKDKIAPKTFAKIYAVQPSKGACGSTTVATNLAFGLKRAGLKRVLLCDLDPITGTVSFLLKIRCQYSFVDVLQREGTLDTDLWRAMTTTHEGVDILLSPETLIDGVQEQADVSSIIAYARQNYDAVVLDTNSIYGQWNLAQANAADEVMVVTTNELPAVQAAQRALAYLEENGVRKDRLRLVLNRFNREVGMSKDVVAAALETEVFGFIPSDFDVVQKGLMEGKPVVSSSSIGKAIGQMCEQLVGKNPGKTSGGGEKKSAFSGLFSMFSRS